MGEERRGGGGGRGEEEGEGKREGEGEGEGRGNGRGNGRERGRRREKMKRRRREGEGEGEGEKEGEEGSGGEGRGGICSIGHIFGSSILWISVKLFMNLQLNHAHAARIWAWHTSLVPSNMHCHTVACLSSQLPAKIHLWRDSYPYRFGTIAWGICLSCSCHSVKSMAYFSKFH